MCAQVGGSCALDLVVTKLTSATNQRHSPTRQRVTGAGLCDEEACAVVLEKVPGVLSEVDHQEDGHPAVHSIGDKRTIGVPLRFTGTCAERPDPNALREGPRTLSVTRSWNLSVVEGFATASALRGIMTAAHAILWSAPHG